MRVSLKAIRRAFGTRLGVVALLVVLGRALVPVGFMPDLVNGELQLVPCDGTMPAHHHHPGTPTPSPHTPCSFAMSGGAMLASAVQPVSDRPPAPQARSATPEFSLPSKAPARHSAPRGPPSLG
jgi:hypothetical protein